MCGIHGIINVTSSATIDPALLDRMGAVTEHRGPDDDGVFAADGVAIGMRRLSIIDLSGGHQPLSNEDGTLQLVCNGEIYNFRELRKELEAKGHKYKTNSDSESVIHAYAEWGDEFVGRLNGMFGFALWDAKRRRLLIGRDHLGIKPVYYLEKDGQLMFASEAKAILALPGVSATIDPTGLDQYLRLGYTPAPYSIFGGMKKLPPGSLMIVEDGGVSIERFWTLPRGIDVTRSESRWGEAVLEHLERSVVAQMVSDVPFGAFLSGGVDSSAVVGFMARQSTHPIQTYAIGFDTSGGSGAGSYYNELPFAEIIAKRFHTNHKEIVVRPNVVQLLPKLLWHMDEPIADSAFITTYLVSKFARQDVTVILSGVGGDELFGGYRRYLGEFYGQYYQMVPKRIRSKLVAPIAERLPADRHSPLLNLSRLARSFLLASELPFEERYRAYVGVFDDATMQQLVREPAAEPYDALAMAFGESDRSDPVRTLFEVDMLTQLPDDLLMLTDKMTMATSLECRVPFLDYELVELAARMPSKHKIRGKELKHILKACLHELLPRELLYRQKRGFGAPMGAWIKDELSALTRNLLSPAATKKRGLFDPAVVQRTLDLHQSSKEDHTDHLLALLNLEVWSRLYIDGISPEDLTAQIEEEIAA